jgi:hypothetical protein
MKIAVVFIPRATEVTMFVGNTHKPPCAFIVGRGFELATLSVLFLCALALAIWNYSPGLRFDPALTLRPETPASPYVYAVPARVIARSFDNSSSVKAGDMVVINGPTAPLLRRVVATPNDIFTLWNGQALNLYGVRGDVFLVVEGDQYTTVRERDIRAVFPSGYVPNTGNGARQFALVSPTSAP